MVDIFQYGARRNKPIQVLILGNPYKDALNNKSIHCILLPGAIWERKTFWKIASINGLAKRMEPPQKRSRNREDETKPNLSILPVRELTPSELRQSADFRPSPTILHTV